MMLRGYVWSFDCGVKFCSDEYDEKWSKIWREKWTEIVECLKLWDLFLTIHNREIRKTLHNYSWK